MAQKDQHQEGGHHIVSTVILGRVCAGLLALTALTVITSRFHLGLLAGPVAFVIAAVKAFLVMAFFMGLKYDAKSNRMIFATGFFFLAVLFFFCFLDITTRLHEVSTL